MPVSEINLGENEIEDVYGLHTVLDDIMKEKGSKELLINDDRIGSSNEKNFNKNVINNTLLEFNCVTSMHRGFILGGNRGSICLYDIEKNFSIVNKMSFEMKMPNGEDHKIFFLSCSQTDSLISIVSYEPTGNISYHLLKPYSIETEISPI